MYIHVHVLGLHTYIEMICNWPWCPASWTHSYLFLLNWRVKGERAWTNFLTRSHGWKERETRAMSQAEMIIHVNTKLVTMFSLSPSPLSGYRSVCVSLPYKRMLHTPHSEWARGGWHWALLACQLATLWSGQKGNGRRRSSRMSHTHLHVHVNV